MRLMVTRRSILLAPIGLALAPAVAKAAYSRTSFRSPAVSELMDQKPSLAQRVDKWEETYARVGMKTEANLDTCQDGTYIYIRPLNRPFQDPRVPMGVYIKLSGGG